VTGDQIARPRLIEILNRGLSGPLSLVSAAAGFGKTTLVSSWIEGLIAGRGGVTPPLPATWLSLDQNDSDLVLFLRYFVAAIRTVSPESCAGTFALLEAPQSTSQIPLVVALSNDIERLPARLVLVLDDYHAIRGEAVHDFLSELIRHWPQRLHLVLISRSSPPLPLVRLRARGLITEIRGRDLRFTSEETAAYVGRALVAPLDEQAVATLQTRTEGWIAGLRLAILSWRGTENADRVLPDLTGSGSGITDYLADEVLAHQPPAIRSFLLKTAILNHFCAELCGAVVGSEVSGFDMRACMDWLERADLFFIPLDNRRRWYRYHHLWRDLLEQRLLAESGAVQMSILHRRAAVWFADQGFVDEALQHALAAGDLDLATGLMEQNLCDVLNREDRPTLDRWLRLVPEDFIQRRPWLLMVRALACQFSWQLPAVWKLLGQIEVLLDEGGAAAPHDGEVHDLPALRGLIALLRGQEAFSNSQAARAIAYCEEALALLPERWKYGRGGALIYWGTSMRASGHGDTAQRTLIDAYESLHEKRDAYALRLLLTVCLNSFETGHLERVSQTAQAMLEQASPSRLMILQGWAHYFLGAVHYCWNELDAAAQHFAEVVDNRHVAHTQAARNGIIGLARVHLARGDIAEARRNLELLSELDLERMGQERDDARSLRGQLAYLQGDAEKAFRWADAYVTPAPDRLLTWLEDPHLTKARILLARGMEVDVQSALDLLDVLYEMAQRTFSVRFQIEILALRALALARQGNADAASAALRQAIELAQPGGFIRSFVDLGPAMQTMLLHLAERGFAAEAVRRILAAFPVSEKKTETGDTESGSRVANARLNEQRVEPLIEPITNREREVLALLRERLSNKEIARALSLSPMTVKRHTANLYGKLGVNKRADAVVKAEALRILPPR
jgi:LuxR family maltose regulon positive regulatory protein